MKDVAVRLANRVQLTTDGHKPYLIAVEAAFGVDIDYAMLHEDLRRDPEERDGATARPCASAATCETITGDPTRSTSPRRYVERQNLTMRMSMRRFTRLTNAFSQEGREPRGTPWPSTSCSTTSLASTRRCASPRRWKSGVDRHVWTIEEIVGLLDSTPELFTIGMNRAVLRRQPRHPSPPHRRRVRGPRLPRSAVQLERQLQRPVRRARRLAGRRADQGVRRHLDVGREARHAPTRRSSKRRARCRRRCRRSGRCSATSDMLAYLAMMAPRLVELRRVLKPTGQPLPALRPDGEPLPEAPARCRLRPGALSQRDHLEAHQRAQQTPDDSAAVHDVILLYAKTRRRPLGRYPRTDA